MQKLAGYILTAFALFISFGDGFALHRWLPLPLAILLVGAMAVAAALPLAGASGLRPGYFGPSDLLLLGFAGMIGLGVLFTADARIKNLTHAIAYTTVILVYGLFLKFLFALDGAGSAYRQRIRSAIALSTLLVSGFALVEFADANWLHLGISNVVPFAIDDKPYNPQFFIFTRARGFEAESAFLALYLNMFLPMSYVWVRARVGLLAGLVLLACGLGAFAVTFSTAGASALVLGICVASVLYLADRGLASLPVRAVVVAAVVALLAVAGAIAAPVQVRDAVWTKLTFAAGTSANERLAAWRDAIPVAEEHPLVGTGVGSTSLETGKGVISFYLTMLKEAGIPALLLILAFLIAAFVEVARLPSRSLFKYAYAIGLVAAITQYAAISNIWFPWLWLLCVLIVDERVGQREEAPPRLLIA